jgi:peroxiredoxin Q/BCP
MPGRTTMQTPTAPAAALNTAAWLKPGQAAPLFSLPDSDMERVDLARFRGRKNVVLYFYPRDGTPACTLQATDFSDHEDDFAQHDCVVIGVSPDDCLCHAEFRDANGVSIVLLADTECEVCEKYGVVEPGVVHAGQAPRHVTRATFVIDKRGVVRHALYNVSPRGHVAQVLDLVRGLGR